jgi:hypothetical protein
VSADICALLQDCDHDFVELLPISFLLYLFIVLFDEIGEMKRSAQAGNSASHKEYIHFHDFMFVHPGGPP